MMQAPLVSIIVPTFNSGKYLNRCLSSIEMQSYQKIEVIIVDAKSQDNTLDIIDHFKSKLDIKCFILGKSTQSEARNLAIQHASGKYIAFCDSDDFYLPEKIKKQLDAMENDNVDVTYFDVLHFYSDQQNRFFINQHPHNEDMIAECIANQTINLNSLMVRKDFLDANQLLFPLGEMGRFGEDGNFIFQLAIHQATFKKLNGNLSVVEVRKDSHTQWEAQWKMKHYAIQYRMDAIPKLANRYQPLLEKSIKSYKFKLVVALILAKKYHEAKTTLKSNLNRPSLLVADAMFVLLRTVPAKWVNWVITTFWNNRRIKTCHVYLPINKELQEELALILRYPAS